MLCNAGKDIFGSLDSVAVLVKQRLNERRWHVFGEAGYSHHPSNDVEAGQIDW